MSVSVEATSGETQKVANTIEFTNSTITKLEVEVEVAEVEGSINEVEEDADTGADKAMVAMLGLVAEMVMVIEAATVINDASVHTQAWPSNHSINRRIS